MLNGEQERPEERRRLCGVRRSRRTSLRALAALLQCLDGIDAALQEPLQLIEGRRQLRLPYERFPLAPGLWKHSLHY